MYQDLHLHTDFSDGENTPEKMTLTAIQCGLKKICFTDHVRHDSSWWRTYQHECKRLQLKYPQINILCGIEAKICDFSGKIDVPDDLDADIFRVAAIHRLPLGDGSYLKKDELFKAGSYAVDCWLKTISGLKNNFRVYRLAHPFSLIPFLDLSPDVGFWNEVSEIFRNADYRIEYNLRYDNTFVPRSFWKEFSHRIDIGSDSHSTVDLSQAWTDRARNFDRNLSYLLSFSKGI